jgi:manganese-dependent inorganic pyrophosphatase
MVRLNNTAIYVIGHMNPDTDAIASAMGYAWFLQEINSGESYIAARAGQLNPQTTWVLQRLNLDPPLLLPDASPRFEGIAHRFNTTTPEHPLREAWDIASRTGGVVPVITPEGEPYGLITGGTLFDWMQGTLGAHPLREETRVADLFARPCEEACDTAVAKFQASSRIKEMLPRILQEERTTFWVIDNHGSYLGLCHQREALHPPRMKLILVDHNESKQALSSLDEAELLEILDHHRLGNPPTNVPIKFTVDIVGSTSTLVSERIADAGLSAPPPLAGLLLAGLVSDTLLLTSPTTTDRDRRAAARLSRWAFIGGGVLAGETLQSYGEQILRAGADLGAREPEDIVTADFKLYEAGGLKFGIGQVELTNFAQLEDRLEQIQGALLNLRDAKGLDFALLMATDVVKNSSRLLLTDEIAQLEVLPYPRRDDGTRTASGVVSRKKQLLPLVLSALGD